MKTCSKCEVKKPFSDFSKLTRSKDGYNGHCKLCVKKHWDKNSKRYPSQTKEARRHRYLKPGVAEDFKRRSAEFRATEEGKLRALKGRLKYDYGMKLEQYNKMFSDQKGCCYICGDHQSKFKKRLHVDHDHKTNKVRALLCKGCNTALGGFKDDIGIMFKAIEYINNHNYLNLKEK